MAATAFDTLFGNGPVDVNVTPGEDAYLPQRDGAIRGKDPKDTLALNWGTDRLAHALAGAAYIAHLGKFSAITNWFIPADPARAAAGPAATASEPPIAEVNQALTDAVLLVVACKVNWWKGNHHTGGSVATGYAYRALRLLGIESPSIVQTSIAWRIAHFFETGPWIAALGATGKLKPAFVQAGTAIRAALNFDDATRKRIASGPAGSAKFEAVYACLVVIASHAIVADAHAPNFSNWAEIVEQHNELVRNAAAYHIGAAYLTGSPRKPIHEFPQPIIGFAATCIRYIDPSSTLCRATVIKATGDDNSVLAAIRASSKFVDRARETIGLASYVADSSTAAA